MTYPYCNVCEARDNLIIMDSRNGRTYMECNSCLKKEYYDLHEYIEELEEKLEQNKICHNEELEQLKKMTSTMSQKIKYLEDNYSTCDEIFCYNEKYCKFCSCEMPKGHEGKHTNGFQVWGNEK